MSCVTKKISFKSHADGYNNHDNDVYYYLPLAQLEGDGDDDDADYDYAPAASEGDGDDDDADYDYAPAAWIVSYKITWNLLTSKWLLAIIWERRNLA